MPEIEFDPAGTLLGTPVSARAATSISTLGILCGANSLNFSAVAVLQGASTCIEESLSAHPQARELVQEFVDDLIATMQELKALGMVDPTKSSGFEPRGQPFQKLLARIPAHAPQEFLQAVGSSLLCTLITGVSASANRTKRLQALSSSIRKAPQLSASQATELQTLLRRSECDLIEVLAQARATQNRSTLKFNAELLIHLRSDLNSEHRQAQEGANPRTYLELSVLIKTVDLLKAKMLDGDCEALITLICFCLNLRWDLALQIPVSKSGEVAGALLWIDAANGLVRLTLTQLLRDLGKATRGCQIAQEALRINLPPSVAQQLLVALLLNPNAQRLGDLIERSKDRPASMSDYWSDSERARFIRSAPPTALNIDHSRVRVCYSFLAFHLITEPDLAYITLSEEQLWKTRSLVFDAVGLGGEAIDPDPELGFVGAHRTPTADTLQSVFDSLKKSVSDSRVGRRYSLKSLVHHHNSYACYVALYLQLASCGRAQSAVEFVASSWFPRSPFGFLADKNTGAAGGRTPIPISPQTSLQLKLLFAHLASLQARLDKILGHKARAAHQRIDDVLRRKKTGLLFLLGPNGEVLPFKSGDLFAGPAEFLTHDFGRHFFGSSLTEMGASLASVHRLLRHQGEGINPQSALGVEIHSDHLLTTALLLDLALKRLGIDAIAGLVGCQP